MAFTKFATGVYKMEDIRQLMTKVDFKTWKNKELNAQTMFKILSEKLYIGIMTVNGQKYKGTHEVFIDENIFYQCQKLIKTSNKGDNISANRINETFPLRHFVLCPSCNRPLIISSEIIRVSLPICPIPPA